MYRFQDDFGLPVELTFDPAVYSKRTAKHVLIFPFLEGNLMFTRNTRRGIELPGGKIEPGETSLAAAVREMYEETGYSLSAIEKIGQYVVDESMVKDIYAARVDRFITEMIGGTVGGVVLFEQIPEQIKGNAQFSRILHDDVYPLTLKFLRSDTALWNRLNQKNPAR
ncbi:NUDIX domain-containing protein [Brevibacillus fulvus]|uniref:8-oxo-dGTP diphosphatase n=1 Tax=Brevibacillus fulvus TaxID=1125967 RepID=A0A938XWE0_9BACL|nr:NUDIX domain-containing protein [Brevibacillus fulvus]MBM7589344.1 8-oxo-dGTP diphosphatase [Brevibacillus fulvus]